MASRLLLLLLLPNSTFLPAEFLPVAGESLQGALYIIMASFFKTSRGEDMMVADHLTMVYVFVLSLVTILLFLFVLGRRLPPPPPPPPSNRERINGILVFLFKASLISALVSLFCILLPEHVSWKTYISFLLGIVAVMALKAVIRNRATRENVRPLDRGIMQNLGGVGKFLYKKIFLLLLTTFFSTSQGQAMLAAEDHLTMVHVLVLSLLGMLFFLSILEPEQPFTSSSSLINKLLVVLLEALLASSLVSVLCILLPDYLCWKAYTYFMLGVAAALAHDAFIHQ